MSFLSLGGKVKLQEGFWSSRQDCGREEKEGESWQRGPAWGKYRDVKAGQVTWHFMTRLKDII